MNTINKSKNQIRVLRVIFGLVGLFGIIDIYGQVQWPFPVSNQQATVTGSVGEYRNTNNSGTIRFHKGVDLTNGTNYAVHAVNGGIVSWNNETGAGASIVTVGSFNYIHILPKLSIRNGTLTHVSVGEYLGDMIVEASWSTHLHMEEARTNFLDHNLNPYVDRSPPYFVTSSIPDGIAFYRNGLDKNTPNPATLLLNQTVEIDDEDYKLVYEKVDIVAHVIDERVNSNGSGDGHQMVPSEITWGIREAEANMRISTERLRFDGIPENAAAVSVFHPLSWAPGSPSIHIITSHPRFAPYDRFWNSRLRTGQTEGWNISGTRSVSLDARINAEAVYKDGKYTVEINANDVDYNDDPNNLAGQQDVKVLIDNFRPYVKDVIVRKFGPAGDIIYHGEWKLEGEELVLKKFPGNDAGPTDHIWIQITTSEPVQSVEVNLQAKDNSEYYEILPTDEKGEIFTTSYTPILTPNNHTLRIRANDLAGNPLQSNPSEIPLRQSNGNWPTVSTTGIDMQHMFRSGDYICTFTGEGGRRRSGAHSTSSSGCLYADFSIDNVNLQTNEAVTFSPVVSGGTLTYNWNFGAGAMPATSTSSGPQTVIYTTGGAKTVSLQICDGASNCVTEIKTGIISVGTPQVPGSLAVDFSASYFAASIGEPFYLTSSVTGSSGTVSYNWDFGEGVSSGNVTVANPEVRYSTPGNKTVSLTVYDANGSATKTRTSRFYVSAPYFSISSTIFGCIYTSPSGVVNLTANTTGGNGPPYNSYTWDFGDGKTATSTSPSISHTYTTGGTYTVRVKVCDETGCGTAESLNCVTVPTTFDDAGSLSPKFLVNGQSFETGLIAVGLNQPVTFTDATTCNGDKGDFHYRWRVNCDYPLTTCLNSYDSPYGPMPLEYVFTTTGPKGVQLRVEIDWPHQIATYPPGGYAVQVVTGLGAGRCFAEIGEVTVSSTCYDPNNKPVFSIPVVKSNCPISKSDAVDMDGNVSYGNTTVNLESSQYNHPVTFPYTADFGFAVYMYDGAEHRFIGTKIQRFTFYAPIVANAGADQQVCLGSTVSIGTNAIEGFTYAWTSIGNAPIAFLSATNVANPTFNGVQKGSFAYRVTVTNTQTGCSKTDDVTIVVDRPEVVGGNFYTRSGTPVALTPTVTGGFGSNSFVWSPGNYLSSTTTDSPSFLTSGEGDFNYSVSVTDQRGCIGSAVVSVNASSAPGNLVAKAEAYSRISLSWLDRSDNETGFLIQRSINGTSDFENLANVTANSIQYQDLEVDKANTYHYRVAAILTASNSNFSNTASVSTSSLPEFSNISYDEAGFPLGALPVGDMDNDGVIEILARISGTNTYKIYTMVSGEFVEKQTISFFSLESLYDLDNDNDNDLDLIGSLVSDGSMVIFKNNITSFSTISTPWGLRNGFAEAVYIDYDSDNDVDIIINNELYLNNGNLNFIGTGNIFNIPYTGYSPGNLTASADFDNDGDQDIVSSWLVESEFNSPLKLYKNQGGTFPSYGVVSTGYFFGSIDIADYDKDGRIDILTSMYRNIFRNIGNNSFETAWFDHTDNLDYQNAAWGDYNFDGQLDFFVSQTRGNKYRLYKNNSNLFTPIPLSSGLGTQWLDFDGDGDLDILLDRGDRVQRNNLGDNMLRANHRPYAPTNLCVYFNKDQATFSWDPAVDSETPSSGLTYNLYVKQGGQFIMSPLANIDNGFRKVIDIGNVSQNTSWMIKLPNSGNIEWGVQAIDNQYVGSVFARNVLSTTHTVCGDITTSTSLLGVRDIIAPNLCSPNTVIVSNGAALTLEAPNEIRLVPGFKVELGSFLNASLVSYTGEENPCVIYEPGGRDPDPDEKSNMDEDEVRVFPNPTNGNFRIEAAFANEVRDLEISIVAVNGNPVFVRNYVRVESLIQEVDLNLLAGGIYIVRLKYDGKFIVRKIVKY